MDDQIEIDVKVDKVRSVSLEELLRTRRGPLDRLLSIARATLMVCGAISLSAALGLGIYYLQGGADDPVLIGEVDATEASEGSAPGAEDPMHTGSLASNGGAEFLNGEDWSGLESPSAAGSPVAGKNSPESANDLNGATVSSLIIEVPPPEEELAEATPPRLPRQRPDGPIIVGRIDEPRSSPFEPHFLDPCEAFNSIGLFRVHCYRESRYVPPPSYRTYAPRPYTPPR
jgi:hypothetical protein